jgi:hypothetical protein
MVFNVCLFVEAIDAEARKDIVAPRVVTGDFRWVHGLDAIVYW